VRASKIDSMADGMVEEAAFRIFGLLGDYQAASAEIGEHVEKSIRGVGPRAAWFRVKRLAAALKFPARELVHCHEAYLVARLAGDGLAKRLPLGAPLDLYRQLFRIARAEGSMEWKKDAILRIAGEVGRGLPEYLAGGLVDEALASRHGRRARIRTPQWECRPNVGLAMAVDTAVMSAVAA
jgi:hypothetical protein